MKTLEEVLAALRSADTSSNLPSNYYRWFDMKDDSQAVVRFLPDKNLENAFGFLVEKIFHSLTINGEVKTVPCLGMYGESCPICKVSSVFYKDGDKVNGKKYYKKRSHIAQVLIMEDPLPPDPQTGMNSVGQVRFISISYQIYQAMKAELETAELDVAPWAYQGGTNFIIRKMRQGDYSTYANSKFTRKSTDLDLETVARIEEQLIDLSTLLPAHPGRERVEQMLEAAMTGTHFDTQQSPQTEPSLHDGGNSSWVKSNEPAPVINEAETQQTADEIDDDEAMAMLAQIRARQAAKRQAQS